MIGTVGFGYGLEQGDERLRVYGSVCLILPHFLHDVGLRFIKLFFNLDAQLPNYGIHRRSYS